MNKIGLSVLAIVATAGSAYGQVADPARFRLETQLLGRTVSATTANSTTYSNVASGVVLNPGDSVRLEIRYRIQVLNAVGGTMTPDGTYTDGGNTFYSAGLTSASLNLVSSRPLPDGSLSAGRIAPGTGAGNNPTVTANNAARGIYNPFRTGVFEDVPAGTALGASNGTFSPLGLVNILPIATSPGPQYSSGDDFAPTPYGPNSYFPVYAVTFTVPAGAAAGTWDFNLLQNPDSEWLFFPGSVAGGDSSAGVTGLGGLTGSSFSVTIVPAPGAAALLGLGGLIVARRRRTA